VKIYTRRGDDGTTGTLSATRLAKDEPRIEAYGTVDELSASLGLVRTSGLNPRLDEPVARIQADLFCLGAALADPDPRGRFQEALSLAAIEHLETEIDQFEAEMPRLTHFILPGGTAASSQLHLARTICRRAERRVVTLAQVPGEHAPPRAIAYLNRLSDWLFTAARWSNHRAGIPEIPWIPPEMST
jgi:cob(I)alamin adenosyltransferase